MEYGDEDGSPGSVPEFGAIFMANSATKKECFRRKLLGLPSIQANFVKRVKAGMILFIFEFEKRELYGVYRASSDGEIDIVPRAFSSSGRQFPAQVRFTVIWYCNPLSEHEFRDAISENYYSNKKFNFGLSEDQVRRLLCLFSSRKSENEVPRRQFYGLTSLTEKEPTLGNEKVSLRNRLKFVEEDSPARAINSDYSGNSPSDSQRPDKERFSENSLGYDTWAKHEGTGVPEDNMDLMEDRLGFNYDEHIRYNRLISDDYSRESLYSSRRQSKENQSLFHETVKTEDVRDAITHVNPGDFLAIARRDLHDDIDHMRDTRGDKHSQSDDRFLFGNIAENFEIPQTELGRPIYDQSLFTDRKIDYDHNLFGGPESIISKNQSNETFFARARRDLNDGRVQMRDIRGDKHIPREDGFRLHGTEGFEIPQTELRRPIDDQRLFMDQKLDYDHNLVGGPNSISMNQVSNSLAKLRRMPDDYEQIHIGCSVDNGITPIVSDRLDKVRRVTDDRKQIPAEQFTSRLDYGGKLNYQESQTNVDNGLGLITSAVQSGHSLDGIKRSDDKHALLKGAREDNAYTMRNSAGLPLPTGYADIYQPRQQPSSFNSSKPMSEAHYSPSLNQHKTYSMFPSVEQRMYATSFAVENKCGLSNPTSGNVVLTRSIPYNPDFPEVNDTSHLAKDFVPHHSRVGNNIAASFKQSPYCTDAENLSFQSDGSLRRVSEVPVNNNQDPYDHYDSRFVKSLLSGGYHEKMEQPSITNEIYEDKIPFPRSPIYERRNSSPSIRFNKHALASEDRVNHNFQENMTDPASSDFQHLVVKYGMGRANLGSSAEKYDDHGIVSYQDPDAMRTDSQNRRTSVFARLSTSSRNQGQEQEGYTEHDVLDASVDQVMETVYECLSQKITKANKHSPLSKRHNKEGTLGAKRREKRFNRKEEDDVTMDDEPTTMTRKMVVKCTPATNDEENADDLLKENRVVEFKRRSETNRRHNEGKRKSLTEGSVQKPEGNREGQVDGKQLKRRKLIRPVFGKKEVLNDDPKGDSLSNSQLTSSNNRPASCDLSGTRLGNLNCQSPNSGVNKKLVRPVFSEKEESNDIPKGDAFSNLHFTSSKNKAASCDFSGTSLEVSPNSRKKLVDSSFGKKEEANDHCKRDGVSDLQLVLTHESSNNQEAVTCESSGEKLRTLNCTSPNSGSLDSNAPAGSGESRGIATKPKLRKTNL